MIKIEQNKGENMTKIEQVAKVARTIDGLKALSMRDRVEKTLIALGTPVQMIGNGDLTAAAKAVDFTENDIYEGIFKALNL